MVILNWSSTLQEVSLNFSDMLVCIPPSYLFLVSRVNHPYVSCASERYVTLKLPSVGYAEPPSDSPDCFRLLVAVTVALSLDLMSALLPVPKIPTKSIKF